MIKVAIHQPHYLPWLGYMAKMVEADCFVFLDTVQYEKNGWQNRNKIKTREGSQWLTVPVRAPFPSRLLDVTIDHGQGWARKHLQALRVHYARAPHLGRYLPEIERILNHPWPSLPQLNVELCRYLAGELGISCRFELASRLSAREEPTDRLLDLCLAVGGECYLAGQDGTKYMALERFEAAGVRVWRQDYQHPVYAQVAGEFLPNLSAVDLLLNHGDASGTILESGNRWVPVDSRSIPVSPGPRTPSPARP
jgi:hypothetical protein